MGSLDLEKGSELSVKEAKSKMGIEKKTDKSSTNKKMKKKRSSLFRRFGCMRSDDEVPVDEGSFEVEACQTDRIPDHLVVMVNGLIGSAEDWKYAAKQFVKAYPQDVIVHCSESNYSSLTYDGVDVMGKRLAEEVISVIERHQNLQKISFIGHSLGGLISRYAIAILYEQRRTRSCGESVECNLNGFTDSCLVEESKRKIAGLEPMNFITVATPHLGSRGHKQVPMFCGLYSVEKLALSTTWILGRTGKHLSLTDCDDGKPPLLVQMVNDSEGLPFISALQSFKRRVAYANMHFDPLVGWSTSSLRRRNELPKFQNLKRNDKYPHIVNVEESPTPNSRVETPMETKTRENKSSKMEEAMIRGLTKLSWERIDVSFKGSKQKYSAHTSIQVKSYSSNSEGADVIQHMIDNFVV